MYSNNHYYHVTSSYRQSSRHTNITLHLTTYSVITSLSLILTTATRHIQYNDTHQCTGVITCAYILTPYINTYSRSTFSIDIIKHPYITIDPTIARYTLSDHYAPTFIVTSYSHIALHITMLHSLLLHSIIFAYMHKHH